MIKAVKKKRRSEQLKSHKASQQTRKRGTSFERQYFELNQRITEFTIGGSIQDLIGQIPDILNETKKLLGLEYLAILVLNDPAELLSATSDGLERSIRVLKNFQSKTGSYPSGATDIGGIRYYPIYCPESIFIGAVVAVGLNEVAREGWLDRIVYILIRSLGVSHRNFVLSNVMECWDLVTTMSGSPETGFRYLLDKICRGSSYFAPIQMERLATAQLLVRQEKRSALRIRASLPKRESDAAVIVRLEASISGKAILDNLEFLLVNPNDPEHRGYYLNYVNEPELKSDSGQYNVEIPVRSELVVPVRSYGEAVAVINLEDKREKAFSRIQVEHLIKGAASFAPLIRLMENQWRMLYEEQFLTIETSASYLRAYAKALKHDLENPIDAMDHELFRIEKLMKGAATVTVSEIAEPLRKVSEDRKKVELRVRGHIDRLSEVGQKDIDVHALVDSVIMEYRNHLPDHEAVLIDFVNNTGAGKEIYAHSLFRAYLFQLIDNARRSIAEKFAKGIMREKPTITFSWEDKEHFNGRFVEKYKVVRIRDNGTGVTHDQLLKLREFTPGTRFRSDNGNGKALVATSRYMKEQGGWLSIDSVEDEYFEVTLAFR